MENQDNIIGGVFAPDFISPEKMAERKEVTEARIEGFISGQSQGFSRGLAVGIACTALFFVLVYSIGKIVS